MLHFFGCSNTWGEDLENRYKEYYPYLVSQKLNQHYHNYARNGNDDFTSINSFFRLYSNGYISPDDTVFMQWSGIGRHGIPFGDTLLQYPWIETELGKWDQQSERLKEATKEYVHFLHDEPILQTNRNMRIMFTAFCSTLPFKVLNYDGWDQGHKKWDKPDSWLSHSFNGLVQELNLEISPSGHPKHEGHRAWSEYLLAHLDY